MNRFENWIFVIAILCYIWDAMKFIYVYTSNDEWKRISSLIEFVKTCYTPKKNYIIEFIPIELKY